MKRRGLIVALYVVAVSLAIGVPYYATYVAPWHRTVLVVDGMEFSLDDVAPGIRTALARESQGGLIEASLRALESLARERLIVAEAERRDLLPSDEALRAELLERVGETSPALADQEQRLAVLQRRSGLSADEQLARYRATRAREALAVELAGLEGGAVEAVHLAGIVLKRRPVAEDLAVAARADGSLIEVMEARNLPGGSLGWTPRGIDESRAEPEVRLDCAGGPGPRWVGLGVARERLPEVDWKTVKPGDTVAGGTERCRVLARQPGGKLIDDIAFALPVGGVSPPLLTEEGYVVIQVIERGPRPVSPEMAGRLQRAALARWADEQLAEARAEGRIRIRFGSDDLTFLQAHGGPAAASSPAALQ